MCHQKQNNYQKNTVDHSKDHSKALMDSEGLNLRTEGPWKI